MFKHAERPRLLLLSLGSALLLAACGGAEDRVASHVERGKAYFTEENWDKARLEFKNVLQIDDKHVEARYMLGQTLERLRDIRGAGGSYLRVVELDPNHVEARIKAAQFLLISGQLDEVRAHVAELERQAPQHAGTFVLRGSLKAGEKDFDGALADAELAIAADPTESNGHALKASVLLAKGDKDGALAVTKAAVEKIPNEASLWVILATLHAERNEVEEAGKAYERLIALAPEEISPRISLARYYAQAGKVDEAERVLRAAVTAFPEDTDVKLSLVEFLSARRDPAAAEQELKTMIEQQPDKTALRFGLGRIYEQTNRLDEAKALYQEIIGKAETGPDGLEGRNRLALIALRQDDQATARKLIEEVLAVSAQDRNALLTRGKMALAGQDAIGAINDFRSVLRDEPNNPDILRLLAGAHALNKEPQLARDALERAVSAAPQDVDARISLARLLIEAGRGPAAVELLVTGLRAVPNDLRLYEALVRAQVSVRDMDGARATVAELKQKFPDMPALYHIAGLLEQADQKPLESIAHFEAALDKAPDAAEPLSQLIKSLMALEKPDQAIDRLQKTLAANERNFVAWNLLGEVYLVQRNLAEAKKAFNKAIELQPKWPVPYRGLALTQLQEDDHAAAIATFEKGLEATEFSLVLVSDFAAYFEGQKQPEKAIQVYERLLERTPDIPAAINNLAMLLLDHRTDAASLERAGQLVAKLDATGNPAFLDTVGWAHYRLGRYEEAVTHLLKAVEAAPESGVLRYHLGMAYAAKGDNERAIEHLQRAVESKERYAGREEAKATLEKLKQG